MLARRISLTAAMAFFLLLWGCKESTPTIGATNASRSPRVVPNDSDAFFAKHVVTELKIELSEDSVKSLRENPRAYVKAKLIENGSTEFVDIGIKLKGAAGSFQELDGKPGFTLNASKFQKSQRYHAMEKFHLNNSVQDESFLCEGLAGQLCREAGVPAARVTHARVWLNERDLGLYVFKEGFDLAFLKRHFRDASGNLYDGGFCLDINEGLEKDSGKGPSDLSDLKALQAACEIEEADHRAEQVDKLLDVEAFINFMALELMMGHWDGYTANKNNYRIYFDPESQKARFLPHGMDQMFQDADFPVLLQPGTIVASAVMRNPIWRERFRERVKQLLPQFSADALAATVDSLDKPLAEYFKKEGEYAARHHEEVVWQLKERLVARAGKLREQISQPDAGPPAELMPLEFTEEGIAELADWYPHEAGENQLEQVEIDDATQLVITVGQAEHCLASWRQRVLLRQGKYRFEAEMKTSGVEPIVDEKGRGGGLRISGANRENAATGDSDWQAQSFEFEMGEPVGEVELVVELRATKGELRIRSPLRLRKSD